MTDIRNIVTDRKIVALLALIIVIPILYISIPMANTSLNKDIVVNMNHDTYTPSDNIEFTIQNNGDDTFSFGRNFEVNYLNENTMNWESVPMTIMVTMDMVILGPDDEVTQSFVPVDHFTNNVIEGKYKIVKSITNDNKDKMVIEKTFMIVNEK